MGSNKNSNTLVTVKPRILKFGDEATSDVIFVIGTYEFKCHKKFLSDCSRYFHAMFYSGFKEKDQSRVVIHEDPDAFKIILDFIYTGYYIEDGQEWLYVRCCKKNDKKVFPSSKQCTCPKKKNGRRRFGCCISYNLWSRCTTLLQLADKYDMLHWFLHIVDGLFVSWDKRRSKDSACLCDGIKYLLATVYSMEKFKTFKMTKPVLLDCLGEVLNVVKDLQPYIRFDLIQLEWLLNKHPQPTSGKCSLEIYSDTNRYDDPNAIAKPVYHNFGIEELSDVTFIVGEEQFKCHKMFLAALSPHFKETFFSRFSFVTGGIVELEGDAVTFGQLMEILYNGSFHGWRETIGCWKGLDGGKDSNLRAL